MEDNTKLRLDNLKALLEKENLNSMPENIETNSSPSIVHNSLHLDDEFTYEQNQFLELFLPLKFNITEICGEVGISRRTYYDWINEKPHFKEAIEHLREFLVDKAEAVLLQALESADAKTAQFILKALDKRYKDKVDITSNGQTVGSTITIIMPKDKDE